MRRKAAAESRLMNLHGGGIAGSPRGQALMLDEIEQRLRALGWQAGHDQRQLAVRSQSVRGSSAPVEGRRAVTNEGTKVPGATRTNWGRLVDVDTGEPLTVPELKRRLVAAHQDDIKLRRRSK